ncbi:hypothetical protein CQA63_02600 [Helicobacter marmotae]|uniref:Uncharacterized protein n=2 Tax=Helicobacter marmotae TaxID=152490 RepID=A0A3D8I5L3_9HELI|nr:hypothetical protein [Helicobacter marmotae]RDU60460.1 hypothetical protein CQA63_02600 [Helicobacter marmotae]
MSSYQTALANTISCLSWHIFTSQVRLTRKSATLSCLERSEESLKESPVTPLFCHSEGARSATEESLSNLLESPQRFFGAEAPQNDNKSNPQDKITLQRKLVCHSEERRSLTEELLLSTKDSLNESLERQLLCHSKHCEETPPESPVTPLFCHSEGGRSPTEESLKESLETQKEILHPLAGVQNDKIISLAGSQVCHSKHCEESLPESLVAKRDSSLDSQAQNDKLTTFTRNPKSNDSQKARRDSSVVSLPQNDKLGYPQGKPTHNKHLQEK